MGKHKQRRRKRTQQPKGGTAAVGGVGNHEANQKKSSSSVSVSSVSSSSGSLVLLQRLRHADARTRHAALAALSTTVFDPDTLARSATSIIAIDLLQAIRERIMDDDLECAQAAAGCLNNYVSFCRVPKHEICAGWTVVLVGRLQQCRDILQQQLRQQQQQHQQHQLVAWLALTVQALQTLCSLVENNPLAVERLEQPSISFGVLQVLLDLLSITLTSHWMETAVRDEEGGQTENILGIKKDAVIHSVATPPSAGHEESTVSISISMLRNISIYAARTFHSAIDDNSDLLLPWLLASSSSSSSSSPAKPGIQLLQQCCSSSSASVAPAAAQLHCAGCLVTAHQVVIASLVSSNNPSHHASDEVHLEPWADILQEALLISVLPLLQQQLRYSNVDGMATSQRLLGKYIQATRAFHQEVADSQLERDVIRQVEQRHEPARSIARRQKNMKEQGQQMSEQQDAMKTDATTNACNKDEDDKDDDDDDDKMMRDTNDTHNHKRTAINRRDAMEDLRQAFHSSLLPLQLALEITANLTAAPSDGGMDADEEEVDDHNMEDDDENKANDENLVVAVDAAKAAIKDVRTAIAIADQLLMAGLVERNIPNHVLALLPQFCAPTWTKYLSYSELPEDAVEEIANLISKCAACLANCLANLTASWRLVPTTLWTTLQQCIITLNSSAASKLNASSDAFITDGLWTVMAVALKSHDAVRHQLRQPEDIEWLLEQLSSSVQHQKQQHQMQVTAASAQQRDIIAMLGVWCRQELHSPELNHKVCHALVGALLSVDSIMVTNEILNALMDMYGNDDHEQVFDSLQVLGHLQRTLPVFKRRLQKQQQQQQNHLVDEQDSEFWDQWNETALNAERFISYKMS